VKSVELRVSYGENQFSIFVKRVLFMIINKCIWCNKNLDKENNSTFSHTIPKSLGGIKSYNGECDSCNSFFGNTIPKMHVSLEGAFTNTIGFLKYKLLNNKFKPSDKKPKSMFFNYVFTNDTLIVEYKNVFLKSKFESYNFGRLFIRSFYKIIISCFFEKHNKIFQSFNISDLQNFCRNDLGNIKLFVWDKKHYLALINVDIHLYQAEFTYTKFKYLYEDENIIEIDYLGIIFILQKKELDEKILHKSLIKSRDEKITNNCILFDNAQVFEIKKSIDILKVFNNSINS